MDAQIVMPKKKILFLITKATWGGAQKYVYDLATTLPRYNVDVKIAYGVEGRLSRLLEEKKINTVRLPSLGRDVALISDIKSFFEMVRCFKETKPDVVHLNSSKAAALGAIAARIAGVPKIIFTVHGWPFKENRNVVARALIYLISWKTALLSHRVIVVSETDMKLASRMWGVKNKAVYIPLGIEEIAPVPPPEGFAKIFGSGPTPQLRSSTLRLVTIGELTPNKGLRYGIAAVAELSRRGIDCVYAIVGEGEERVHLQRFATDTGVADRVYFPGFVIDAAQYLGGFDVFVLPSLKEGTPYVLLEAGAVGLPIVTTTVVDTELKERFRHMRCVPPGDENAIADAILELSTLPRGSDARPHGPSLREMIEKTVSLYR